MATLFDNLFENITNVRSERHNGSALQARGRQLEVRLPSGWPDSGELEWCLRESGEIRAHGSVPDIGDLPAEVRSAPLHVWSPADATLLTTVKLPTRSRNKIARALPYALEDRLLTDPAQLFFTYDFAEQDQLDVSVTSREMLSTWYAKFSQRDLQLRSLTPEILAIPLLTNAWSLFCDAQGCWLRTGQRSGFRCDVAAGSPPHLLTTALEQSGEKPETLVFHNPPEGTDLKAWEQVLGMEILTEHGPFQEFAEYDGRTNNLLQSEFSPPARSSSATRVYRPALIMFAIWLIGTIAMTTVEWWRLDNEHQRLVTEMTDIFKSTFPQEAGVIYDPYKQMQANLAGRSSDNDTESGNSFLPLLSRMAPVIGGKRDGTITEIAYRKDSLELSLNLPDYRSFETIKSNLNNGNIQYTVLRTRQTGGVVQVRLRID